MVLSAIGVLNSCRHSPIFVVYSRRVLRKQSDLNSKNEDSHVVILNAHAVNNIVSRKLSDSRFGCTISGLTMRLPLVFVISGLLLTVGRKPSNSKVDEGAIQIAMERLKMTNANVGENDTGSKNGNSDGEGKNSNKIGKPFKIEVRISEDGRVTGTALPPTKYPRIYTIPAITIGIGLQRGLGIGREDEWRTVKVDKCKDFNEGTPQWDFDKEFPHAYCKKFEGAFNILTLSPHPQHFFVTVAGGFGESRVNCVLIIHYLLFVSAPAFYLPGVAAPDSSRNFNA